MKQLLRLTLTLFLICAVTAAALAGVNSITKDRIAAIQEEKNQAAMRQVLPEGQNLQPVEFTDDSGMVQAVYAPDGERSAQQYAIKVTPNGFGGQMVLMVGVSHQQVTGISVVSHAETPSLGATAAAKSSKGEAFRQQFNGMSGELAVNKDGGEIDAITSATITSRAVTAGVNAALRCAENLG